jgi:hypothetical protein
MNWKVPPAGFLGSELDSACEAIVEANADWFSLAKSTNLLTMRIMQEALDKVHATSWSAEAIAVRLLLRAAGIYQGALLMAQRGMHVEGRIMARSLLEVSFSVGALTSAQSKYIQMLRDDHLKSRRNRFQTLQNQGHAKTPGERKALQEAIESLSKSLDLISPKTLASMSPLEFQYYAYQCLSDESSHVSASSLEHHVNAYEERAYWEYKIGAGPPSEIAKTLFYALYAMNPILIGVAEVLKFEQYNDDFNKILTDFDALPKNY